MKAEQLPAVRIERANGIVFVSFQVAEIDERNFAMVADQLDEVARAPTPQSVIIDLSGVNRIDELGLVVLESLRESVKEVGGTSVLTGPTEAIKRPRESGRFVGPLGNRTASQSYPQFTH